jgi:hypothetical protein
MVMANSKKWLARALGVVALVGLSLTSVEAQEAYKQNTGVYLRAAIAELNKRSPDFQAAFDSLDTAVDQLQMAISMGELDGELGARWMDRVTAIAGQVGSDQLDDTGSRRRALAKEKPAKKDSANAPADEPANETLAKEQLVAGDASRAAGEYRMAIHYYRQALPEPTLLKKTTGL